MREFAQAICTTHVLGVRAFVRRGGKALAFLNMGYFHFDLFLYQVGRLARDFVFPFTAIWKAK